MGSQILSGDDLLKYWIINTTLIYKAHRLRSVIHRFFDEFHPAIDLHGKLCVSLEIQRIRKNEFDKLNVKDWTEEFKRGTVWY